MLVRFNKGPWHRRLQHMDPRDVQRGQVNVAIPADNSLRTFTSGTYATTVFNHKVAVYTIKMVVIDFGDGPRQIPSVYPDGAICFEHKETI